MRTYHEIEGDGGSQILEQVLGLRGRIAESLAGVRHILAVGSGKGGVGKSTLTAQLCRAMRRGGAQVAILDTDLNGPTQARLNGLAVSPPIPGRRGLLMPRTREGMGVVSLGALVPEAEAVHFESVAHGDSHVWRATREFTLLAELLASVEWGALDVLVADLPPGAERTVQVAEFLGQNAAFVLVTIPSDLARGVVARSLAGLSLTQNRVLGYIENMSGYFCADCGVQRPLFPSTAGVDLPIDCLGRVPFDPRLAEASDRGVTELPEGPVGAELLAIADTLLEKLEG